MEKMLYLTPYSLQRDSTLLARKILDSGFKPDFLTALWRGGAQVGIYVQEILQCHGVHTDHFPIKTSAYEGDQQKKTITVWGLDYLLGKTRTDHSLLIIDDVFDTGMTNQKVLKEMQALLKENMPSDVRMATVYFKPSRNQTLLRPDYYVKETNDWIIFPHEFDCLKTRKEINDAKGQEIADIISAYFKV